MKIYEAKWFMKVSVIIPTFNREHLLKETMEYILNQTFKDFELIIVDNYSSDNTENAVKSYNDKRIRYFKNQNNGVIAVNRNFGIKKARGEFITFCDDDDLWLPQKLEKQLLSEVMRLLVLAYNMRVLWHKFDIKREKDGQSYFRKIPCPR